MEIKLEIKEEPQDLEAYSFELKPETNDYGATHDTLLENVCQADVNEYRNFEEVNIKLEINEQMLDPNTGSHKLKSETVEENVCNVADNSTLEYEATGQEHLDIALMKEEIAIEQLAVLYKYQGLKPGSVLSQSMPDMCGTVPPTKSSICNSMCQGDVYEYSNFEEVNIKLEIKEEMLDPNADSYELKSEIVEENSCNATHDKMGYEVKGQEHLDVALMKEDIAIDHLAFLYTNQGSEEFASKKIL